MSDDVDDAMTALRTALRRSQAPDAATAWLALVTVDGSYPCEDDVHDALLQRLRNEAHGREPSTWAEYADAVWAFLVDGNPA